MSLTDFIGFIITMAILVFLFFRQILEQRRRTQNPEFYEQQEREREEALREFFEELHGDKEKFQDVLEEVPPEIEEPIQPPAPPLQQKSRFQFETTVEEFDSYTRVGDSEFRTKIGQKYARSPRNIYDKRVFDTRLGKGDVGDEYAIRKSGTISRAKNLVSESRSLKNQMVLRDILGPPKSLQSPE